MKLRVFVFVVLLGAFVLPVYAGGGKEKPATPPAAAPTVAPAAPPAAAKPTEPPTIAAPAQTAPVPAAAPASLYWTGDGAADLSVAVLVPDGKGLSANEAYLPTMVQGVLVGDFTKFSAMTVLDRQNLDKVIAEGESGFYADESNFAQLGTVTNTRYMLNGALQKTGSGFSLQLKVTEAASGVSKAAYTGAVSAAELENQSGIKKASADLLAQLGVSLTAAGKAGLQGAASTSTVQAETALAKGIVAQRNGTVVEAMSYYYEAARFDPSLAEAASRNAVITASVTSGSLGRSDNLGQNVRNEIERYRAEQRANTEWRDTWAKTLADAAAFFKEHPPFQIIYDPTLTQSNINYAKETVDISFTAVIAATAGFKIIRDLEQGLAKTGRNGNWQDVAGNVTAGWGLGVQQIYNAIPARYTIYVSLTNEDGEKIGTTGRWWEPVRSYDYSHRADTVTFSGVDANKITDKLTVTITEINGMSPQTAGERGYKSIVTAKYDVPGDYDVSLAFGEAGIAEYKYKGTHEQLVIPRTILGRPVTTIGDEAFNHVSYDYGTGHSNLTLRSVIIPSSVRYIGKDAFFLCGLQSITIGANVDIAPHSKWSPGTSPGPYTLPDRFIDAYRRADKQAGTYTYYSRDEWRKR
ncbi:MAG: leucine-rich repeat domain-containing protein [Spirochaetaceae bacterium]|nr:leucine-rich repeat domain-containing protein [Spirochaetaceae bacterium]